MVKFTVELQSKRKDPKQFAMDLPATTTVEELTVELAKQTKIHKYRQGLKIEKAGDGPKPTVVRLSGRQRTLDHYNVEGETVILKDMGPQFSYRGVFLIEYGGPLVFMLLYALRPALLFGAGFSLETVPGAWSDVAVLGVWCWCAHFLKRELETLFVHKFSRPTMPLGNLFKNSIYYWTFAAIVGLVLCHPDYTPTADPLMVKVGLGIFAVSELLNGAVHLQLAGMRPKEGSDERKPPAGGLFALCSCPNYFFEVTGWVGFSLMTSIPFAWAFTLVGFLQMWQWAASKHRMYVKQDPSLKKRAAIIPFLL